MMRYKILRSVVCILCLVLILLAAACSQTPSESSPVLPTPTPAPEADPTPAPEADPTPAPEVPDASSQAPESSEPAENPADSFPSAGHILPNPEYGDAGFTAYFNTNTIDREFEQALIRAGSVSQMLTAYQDAAAQWQAEIDRVYVLLIADGAPGEKDALKKEQMDWVDNTGNALAEIRDRTESDPSPALAAAEQILLYYRDRAIALHYRLYTQQSPVTME